MLEAGKAGNECARGGSAYASLSPSLVKLCVFEVLGKVVSHATLVPAEGFETK